MGEILYYHKGAYMQLKLIENWTQFWKMRSIQIMALLAVMPEILQLAVEMGVLDAEDADVPAFFNKALKIGLFIGAVSRLLQQKGITKPSEPAAA